MGRKMGGRKFHGKNPFFQTSVADYYFVQQVTYQDKEEDTKREALRKLLASRFVQNPLQNPGFVVGVS